MTAPRMQPVRTTYAKLLSDFIVRVHPTFGDHLFLSAFPRRNRFGQSLVLAMAPQLVRRHMRKRPFDRGGRCR
jgi:hypothetical protein